MTNTNDITDITDEIQIKEVILNGQTVYRMVFIQQDGFQYILVGGNRVYLS